MNTQRKILLSLVVCCFAFTTTSKQAFASYNHMFTFGLGVHSSMNGDALHNGANNPLTMGINAQVKFLKYIGVTISYDLTGVKNEFQNKSTPHPELQLTGHLFLANWKHLSLSVAGGGNMILSRKTQQRIVGYHLGADFDFRLNKRIVMTTGFRFNLPTVQKVEEQLSAQQKALETTTKNHKTKKQNIVSSVYKKKHIKCI